MGAFRISGLILGSLFRRPATAKYPAVPREWEERTRGRIEIDASECILCGMCARKCPADALAVDKAEATWEIDMMGCVQCGHCTEICPKKCLRMEKEYTAPDCDRRTGLRKIPVPKKVTPRNDR
ncbi:MAG: 4Fe-4S dicluster domain-containing protein [Candidatus Methanoplasma sp.]|jgi:formate hydrogenlyase subunit 6/NADH:ubiquinone oxidoreductase subunit I|nr:4Fe-4S dicluster domain-containing protein [Candidatus Methanoplasma sp.]